MTGDEYLDRVTEATDERDAAIGKRNTAVLMAVEAGQSISAVARAGRTAPSTIYAILSRAEGTGASGSGANA